MTSTHCPSRHSCIFWLHIPANEEPESAVYTVALTLALMRVGYCISMKENIQSYFDNLLDETTIEILWSLAWLKGMDLRNKFWFVLDCLTMCLRLNWFCVKYKATDRWFSLAAVVSSCRPRGTRSRSPWWRWRWPGAPARTRSALPGWHCPPHVLHPPRPRLAAPPARRTRRARAAPRRETSTCRRLRATPSSCREASSKRCAIPLRPTLDTLARKHQHSNWKKKQKKGVNNDLTIKNLIIKGDSYSDRVWLKCAWVVARSRQWLSRFSRTRFIPLTALPRRRVINYVSDTR